MFRRTPIYILLPPLIAEENVTPISVLDLVAIARLPLGSYKPEAVVSIVIKLGRELDSSADENIVTTECLAHCVGVAGTQAVIKVRSMAVLCFVSAVFLEARLAKRLVV